MRLIFLDIGNNGIVEVTGSIPVGSTNKIKGLEVRHWALSCLGNHKVTLPKKIKAVEEYPLPPKRAPRCTKSR
jgi:hypothetical protein